MNRRLFLATGLSGMLGACSQIGTALNDNAGFHRALGSAQWLNEQVIGTHGRARLYSPADISKDFPVNSLPTPTSARYQELAAGRFTTYRLIVDGAVEHPYAYSLSQLHALPQQRQITRHDCVEGWSVVCEWQGVRLAALLASAVPRRDAKYVVFRTFDTDSDGTPYYESLSMQQAAHPQTLLALRQNGRPIEVDRGAPVRLTVPTQLGYKSAKWVARIEVVADMSRLYGGNGGYWEDQGYEWYAGI